MGSVRFGVPREFVLWLSKVSGIRHFVETGTNKGETAAWAASCFERVTTIEGLPVFHEEAKRTYGHHSNIDFILGDSRAELRAVVAALAEPAIFWLDAHWCGAETFGANDECPVLDEILAVDESSLQHVILVDDARLFLAPPPLPHQAAHWPGIAEVCAALTTTRADRYVAVHEDVILAVPSRLKADVVNVLQAQPLTVPSQQAAGFRQKLRTALRGGRA